MRPRTLQIRLAGFTIIELLVVIAIIGVLAAVVLVSLSTARYRGIDAGVKSNLHTIQNQAELYFGSNNNQYGTAVAVQGSAITAAPAYNQSGANFFVADQQANSALVAALSVSPLGYYAIGIGGNTYALAVGLMAETGYWCVDTGGAGKIITSVQAAALGGGTSAAACP